jgi:hypothetical protein
MASPARWRALSLLAAALLAPAAAHGGEADVVSARAQCDPQRVCRFAVGVRHADAGWDHYADRFEVLSADGEVLATRVLRHPHVEEQPFTRELEGVALPPGVRAVRIRAHDSVHGFGGAELDLAVPDRSD